MFLSKYVRKTNSFKKASFSSLLELQKKKYDKTGDVEVEDNLYEIDVLFN